MHRSLRVTQASDFGTVYPMNVQHRSYPARLSTEKTVSWTVDSPSTAVLLDAEAYILWTVTVTDPQNPTTWANMFEGADADTGDGVNVEDRPFAIPAPDNTRRAGFRQGFCVTNAVDRVDLRLNQSHDYVSPSMWNGEFMRFFALPEEVDSICTMSGGGFDSGNFSNRVPSDFVARTEIGDVEPGVGGVLRLNIAEQFESFTRRAIPADTTMNPRRSTPLIDGFYNPGFTDRWHWFAKESRLRSVVAQDFAAQNGGSRYSTAPTFVLAERIPIDPFMLWERKDGNKRIPGVRRLELDYTFSANARHLIIQGNIPDTELFVDYWSVRPTLRLKWITPPPALPIPMPSVIPYTKMDELLLGSVVIDHPTTDAASVQQTFTVREFKLRGVPKLMLIYFKPRAGNEATMSVSSPTERHLEIVDLRLGYTTAKGSLLNASSQELFALYVKNSPVSHLRPFDYQQWRRRYCTVALRPEDHGVQYTDPGGIFLDLELTVQGHWNFPSVGRDAQYSLEAPAPAGGQNQYELHLVAMYDWGISMTDTDSDIRALHE